MVNAVKMVQTTLGEKYIDSSGSAIGAGRVNPADAYGAIPLLLKDYIDSGSESAWREIKQRVDNVFLTVCSALEALDAEVSFTAEVTRRIESGKTLFIKPNIVEPNTIDYVTHGPGLLAVCTPWEVVAAVMRWFHDKQGISYHRMAVGEGATGSPSETAKARRIFRNPALTTLALMEGKYGDDYGGWGFYFARKYLAECHDSGHRDDPMRGYEESLAGACLPPGSVNDKLLLYDINKVDDTNGRDVPVTGGRVFQSITMHKAVVGGEPGNRQDCRDWPGCVLVNIAKLKIHAAELITGAIKNLGIGLYPMELNTSREPGKYRWKYGVPPREWPAFKMSLPHTPLVIEIDESTGLPVRDKNGQYIIHKTGGLEGTMGDALQAVKDQDIMMLHVVDAIETTNLVHSSMGNAIIPEGLIFASTDPVAVDVLGARYMYSMVPMAEAASIQQEHRLASDVIQKVPVPEIEGKNIVTGEGYDTAFSRYGAFKKYEEQGLGRRQFYVAGKDLWQGGYLASVCQRFGRVADGVFTELLTKTMYHALSKPLWDLQATCLAYLDANDRLTGSDYKRTVMALYDENGDGVIDYMEKGPGVPMGVMAYGMRFSYIDIDPMALLKHRFLLSVHQIKLTNSAWNIWGHNISRDGAFVQGIGQAMQMSKAPRESPDPLFPGMTWGNGKWPSLQSIMQQQKYSRVYGPGFPKRFDLNMSPYGLALRYADTRYNGAKYCSAEAIARNEDIIGKYHAAVAGGGELLPFVMYVPPGYGSAGKGKIANVVETEDPALIFSADFNGKEQWRELRLEEVP